MYIRNILVRKITNLNISDVPVSSGVVETTGNIEARIKSKYIGVTNKKRNLLKVLSKENIDEGTGISKRLDESKEDTSVVSRLLKKLIYVFSSNAADKFTYVSNAVSKEEYDDAALFALNNGAEGASNINFAIRPGMDVNMIHVPSKNGHINLFLPGNTGKMDECVRLGMEQYHHDGTGFIIPSYRGYAQNQGKLKQYLITHDTLCLLEFMHENLGYEPRKTHIFAHSLGTAIAVNTIAKWDYSPEKIFADKNSLVTKSSETSSGLPKHKIASLTLNAPMTSIGAVMHKYVPFIPRSVICNIIDYWNNIRDIKNIATKIDKLIINHPQNDELIPVKHSYKLSSEAKRMGINTELNIIPSTDHVFAPVNYVGRE